jgi:hypothetical protein
MIELNKEYSHSCQYIANNQSIDQYNVSARSHHLQFSSRISVNIRCIGSWYSLFGARTQKMNTKSTVNTKWNTFWT